MVQDSVQTLSLAQISLGRVWDPLLGKSIKVVGLSLPVKAMSENDGPDFESGEQTLDQYHRAGTQPIARSMRVQGRSRRTACARGRNCEPGTRE